MLDSLLVHCDLQMQPKELRSDLSASLAVPGWIQIFLLLRPPPFAE